MRNQVICIVILTTLAAFSAVADEVEPTEEPSPVRATPPNTGGEVPVPVQETGPEEAVAEEGGMSAECIAFRADIDANIGDIMRAGCEPTLGQMSKLMDNPIGNVAIELH